MGAGCSGGGASSGATSSTSDVASSDAQTSADVLSAEDVADEGGTSEDVAEGDAVLEEDAVSEDTPPEQPSVCEGSYDLPGDAGAMQEPDLVEASGIVASRRSPGVLWLHNDSGDTARLFALADDGAALGRLSLSGVDAVDFEDIALGPCPDGDPRDCLWVADMGNNGKDRDDLAIYAVPEPEVSRAQPLGEARADALWRFPVAYPGGEGIDSEGLVVAPDGSALFVFEKIDGDRARVFRYSAPFTSESEATLVEAASFDSVGVAVARGRMITGADLHPSGQRLVIRVYTGSFEYRFGPGQGVESLDAIEPILVAGGPLSEPQGEAIGYDVSGTAVWTVSEDRDQNPGQQLHVYPCLDP